MKSYKVFKILVPILIILSTIFIFKDRLISLGAKYAPLKIKSIAKIILYKGDYSKRLENDYNVKFLPETQLVNLRFDKIKLDFLGDAQIGYFQKTVKKNSSIYKSFYIDFYENKLLITDSLGKIFSTNLNQANENKFKKIQSNSININKTLDTLVVNDLFYISYIKKEKNSCNVFHIARAKLNGDKLNFKNFFKYDYCGKWIQGGRMQKYEFNGEKGIIFSLADNVSDKPTEEPQSDKSLLGKILFKSFNGKDAVIFSKGHRNPQGLLVLENNIILSTEHGPKGGDEINLIKYGKNYGWPIASYGSKYLIKENYKFNHSKLSFEEPIYAFLPSIGISEIIKVSKRFENLWDGSFLIASLNKETLFRVMFNENFSKVILIEEIFIGQRIRDLKVYDNILFLALEGKGELGILRVDKKS